MRFRTTPNLTTQYLSNLGSIHKDLRADLKERLLDLFNAIKSDSLSDLTLDSLLLFNYDEIDNPKHYYLAQDGVFCICELFGINKYSDIINPIRVNNGLGYDDSFLRFLIRNLKKNVTFIEERTLGLINLLEDNNLVYNNLGIRINIIRFLINNLYRLSDLNSFQIDNSRLNGDYSYLVYKNNKIKGYSKLGFKDDNIILSTLMHDRVANVVYTFEKNPSIFYGGEVDLSDNKIYDIDLNLLSYKVSNGDINNIAKYLYYLIDKYTLIEDGLSSYEASIYCINYNSINIDDYNIYEYMRFFNAHYQIIQRYDNLLSMYERIIKRLKQEDDFYNNSLESDSLKRLEQEDYFKYDIDLKDYFINP